MEYYTYVYMDPRKPGDFKFGNFKFDYEPFYIGKGKDARCYSHLTECMLKKGNLSPKVAKLRKLKSLGFEPIIKQLQYFENESAAYTAEIELIKNIGSSFINDVIDGPLVNLTYGGTNPPNHRGKTYLEIYGTVERAEEQRVKRHKIQLSRGGFFKGGKHTEETKRKHSLMLMERQKTGGFRTGILHTERDKLKMLYLSNFKFREDGLLVLYKIKSNTGQEYFTSNLKRFCKFLNISASTLKMAYSNKRIPNRGRTKGWTIIEQRSLTKIEHKIFCQIIYKKIPSQ